MNYSKESNYKKRKSASSKTKKARNRIVTIVFRILVSVFILFIFAAGGVAFGAYMGVLESISHLDNISAHPDFESSIVFDRYGNEIARFLSEENREFVYLSQIPLHLQQAFIAIEDQRFFEHNGVDIRGTLRAIYVTLFVDGRMEGGSTITQQLIKNNVLRIQRNTIESKLQEQFLALRLENDLTEQLGSRELAKKHILELYLNTINLGGQIHGVQTAARFYFNKDVEDLTISEAAVIASITQNPSRYNPVNNPQFNRLRQTTVLNRMLAQGFITEAEHAYALADPVFDRISEFRIEQVEQGSIRSYFVDNVFNQVADDLIAAGFAATRVDASHFIHNRGLRIETTKNPRIQAILEEAYMNDSLFPNEFEVFIEYRISFRDNEQNIHHRETTGTVANFGAVDAWVENTRASFLGEDGYLIAERYLSTPQPQSAMVILDHNTGHVHGIIGGRGEKQTNLSFNRATDSRRQPGSVFKMVAAYAPAFDLGLMAPGSIIIDRPLTVNLPTGAWSPQNWQGRFFGPINVRRAVADSFNVIAARITLEDVGIDRAFDYLMNFGFDLPNSDRVPAMSIGGLTHGVTQMELAGAFGAIANNGIFIEPIVYTRVLDSNGNVILNNEQQRRQVMRPQAAYLLTSTMEDVLTQGTGSMARLNSNMAVAGKTGTSQYTRDLSFVGYTPHFTASIWLGHDQPRTLRNPGNAHLRMWSYVMNRIHEGLPVISSFERPPGIVTAQIDLDTGLLALPGISTRVRTDIFDSAFMPSQRSLFNDIRLYTPSSSDYYEDENSDNTTTSNNTNDTTENTDFSDYFNLPPSLEDEELENAAQSLLDMEGSTVNLPTQSLPIVTTPTVVTPNVTAPITNPDVQVTQPYTTEQTQGQVQPPQVEYVPNPINVIPAIVPEETPPLEIIVPVETFVPPVEQPPAQLPTVPEFNERNLNSSD
ncbi:MAG: transglycosylase domain-containing protein [Defluviitaleaceae bacterium]|nr:transglycosylase domain-containing protein [Defluviitaleaceae bacterium]